MARTGGQGEGLKSFKWMSEYIRGLNCTLICKGLDNIFKHLASLVIFWTSFSVFQEEIVERPNGNLLG